MDLFLFLSGEDPFNQCSKVRRFNGLTHFSSTASQPGGLLLIAWLAKVEGSAGCVVCGCDICIVRPLDGNMCSNLSFLAYLGTLKLTTGENAINLL
jgi:hypothetical protein